MYNKTYCIVNEKSICNNIRIILVNQIHYITEKRQYRQCMKDIDNAPPRKTHLVECELHSAYYRDIQFISVYITNKQFISVYITNVITIDDSLWSAILQRCFLTVVLNVFLTC